MDAYHEHPTKRQRLNDGNASTQDGFGDHKFREEQQPNKVLLFTIINAVYPITTEILYSICHPCGEVQRIVIFRKRAVQAMVEFDSIQSAQQAKASLNGADIYSGCCTLKIEWAKPARLNVFKNDDETWDYTTPAVTEAVPTPPPQPALLGDAPPGYKNGNGFARQPGMAQAGMTTMGMPVRSRLGMGGVSNTQSRPRPTPGMGLQPQARANVLLEMPPMNEYLDDFGMQQDSVSAFSQSPVLMLYGLNPDKMNCDRVFNILCLYGNVIKVKFLKSKPGTAMVQMGDPIAVDRAISGLSGMRFFDEKLVLAPSKQMFLTDSGAPPSDLPDKTPSQVDYTGSRNNRFTTTEMAAKNRIQNPSKVLHYYNAPVDLDEEKLNAICEEFKLTTPTKFVQFKGKSDRSSSGLMEFDTKSQALEALTCINHHKLDNPSGRYPYIVKLCFSTSSSASTRPAADRD